MQLISAKPEHIADIATWVSSLEELRTWAGPAVRYPLNHKSLAQDLTLNSLDSFVLVSDDHEILAFGQCYLRLSRCHLGRLIVAPEHRGKRIAETLIKQLCEFGQQHLPCKGYSLFVLENNVSAIRTYQRLGFEFSTYPTEIPLDNCLYMVKP